MSEKNINYLSRNFGEVRSELIDLIKQYYPNILSDFNDASIASVFIDLNAAVTDLLSYHTDRTFQETQIDYALQRKSLLGMARTLGLKMVGKRPSVTVCDFSITVPTNGESFDESYLPILRRGTQVSGNGKIFELLEDSDFSNPFGEGGIQNRLVIPNISATGSVINYTITKREIVQNGVSKIFKKVITLNEAQPFYNIVLSDNNVLNVESIIALNGTSYTETPNNTVFYNDEFRWYEMESLAENKVFIEQTNLVSTDSSVKIGKWVEKNKKFITEYTGNGFLKITFGGGNVDVDKIFTSNTNLNQDIFKQVGNIINNNSLGETLKANTTLFIKYRVGGGDDSNIGSGVLNRVIFTDMFINGVNPAINSAVRNSLRVNNPIPALGGRNEPTLEEIRNAIKYNFSSQKRAVTLKDYHGLIAQIPPKFGAPYRYGVMEEQNKIVVNVISKDSDGKLTEMVSKPLKDNISEYLSDYRMINDYVQVKSGKVINLGIDVDIMLENNVSKNAVISTVIQKIIEYFNSSQFQMGDNIYIGDLIENINNINGVLNVINIVIINKFGNKYSNSISSQAVLQDDQYIIDYTTDFTIFGEINSMFEIKFPNNDIRCRIK